MLSNQFQVLHFKPRKEINTFILRQSECFTLSDCYKTDKLL